MQPPYNYDRFRFSHVIEEAVGVWRLRGPLPGSPAPDFALPDTNGRAWRLSDRRGQIVLLHFGSYT
jgi:hypothetical protein